MDIGLIDIGSSVLICMAWYLFLQIFPLHGITHKVTTFNKHIFISSLVAVLLFMYLESTLGTTKYLLDQEADKIVNSEIKTKNDTWNPEAAWDHEDISSSQNLIHALLRSIILIVVLSYYLSYLYSVPFYVLMIPLFGILVFQMYFRDKIKRMIDKSNKNEQYEIKSLDFYDFINIYLF